MRARIGTPRPALAASKFLLVILHAHRSDPRGSVRSARSALHPNNAFWDRHMTLLPLLSLLLAPIVPGVSGDGLTGPGVSRALAERRAAQIAQVRYALQLDVTRRDTAVGHARVRFVRRGGGDVILDFRGLGYSNVMANGATASPRAEHGHLVIAAAALRDGENEVALDFQAAIAPAGASVIRVHDALDNADYLYTLRVPADANQLFPCFDQPDLKARVKLALAAPAGWSVLANGAEFHADTIGGMV